MLVIPYSLMGSAQIKKRHICLTLAEIEKRGLSEKLSKCHTVTLSHSDARYFAFLARKKLHRVHRLNSQLPYTIIHSKTQFLTGCCQSLDVTQ